MSNIKQVIVIRKDLNMRKGKMVAQGAHASMAVLLDRMDIKDNGSLVMETEKLTDAMKEWISNKFTKICVSVSSEQELLAIYNSALAAGIPCSIIKDAGLTEFNQPTYTAVAIGPAPAKDVDQFTGALPLL